MNKEYITWSQLKASLKKAKPNIVTCRCHYDQYLEWRRIEQYHAAQLISIGHLVDDNHVERAVTNLHPLHSYWGENAVMPLGYYPYGGSEVFACMHCWRLFFIYAERTEQTVETRARWIRELLLVYESPD